MAELSTRQIEALPFIAGAATHAEGCKRAGISRNTFYKWMREPTFKAEMMKRRDQIVTDALDILKSYTGKAVAALVALLKTDNEGLRRQTANDIIGYVLKLKELSDIEGRLDTIEKAVSDLKEKRSLNS